MSGLWVPIAWNVGLATVLAAAVALASCLKAVRHRPALRHTLWALVLLKLVTPPLIPVPVLPSHPVESSVISTHVSQELPPSSAWQPRVDSWQEFGVPPIDNAEVLTSPELANLTADSVIDAPPEANGVRWPVLLVWLSVCGTLTLAGWNVVQMSRVSGLLRRATPGDPRLKRLVTQASSWVGTNVVPEIRVVDARVTPLLWARLRRPIVVLPRGLVDQLNDEQVSCILRHEMAHHVRRDHWANASGFVVAALFWWHPVVWWARREMHIAQELCCDALVLSGCDTSRRCYAETLFQTLEFVQAERPLVAILGVGFGPSYSVKRRFEMIANAAHKERGSWWTYALILSVVIALPCLPVQGEPASDAEQIARRLPAKIAQLDIDSATPKRVIEVFGKPERYIWEGETFEADALPIRYIMCYPGDFNIFISNGRIVELRHESDSKYVYRGKLRVGSTLEEALAVLGPPKETVTGENNYDDRVLYKDIDGNKGHCYYLCTDEDVRVWFSDYKVAAIYMTRSDYGEEEDEPDEPEFRRQLASRLEKLDIDSATPKQVIEVFGEPRAYRWGDEIFEPDALPGTYIMCYPGDFNVFISNGRIVEVRHESDSKYVYRGKLRVGSSLEEALAVLGPPKKTVTGENNYEDRVLYKDIDGTKGHCYYLRTDQDVRVWFGDYKVAAIYMTRSDYGEDEPGDPEFRRQLASRLERLDIDSATREQIIEIFGQPVEYVWSDETFKPDALPLNYIMNYPCDFSIWVSDGQIEEVRFGYDSKYVYRGKLRVGSILDEALAVLGPPEETVDGENKYKDRVLYKDIDGRKGHCYYLRTDQDIRLWFSNYRVAAIYMTRSDFGEEKPDRLGQAYWHRLTEQLEKLDIDSAGREQVLEIFGRPKDYVWGNESFEPDALPEYYIMRYPGDFNIWLRDGRIMEVRHERNSKYVYREKLRIGSTLDEALALLGQPEQTVSGQENAFKDRVLYKDIDGDGGHCYYHCGDQNVRLWFANYKVIAIYMTRSDFPTR